jgi:hypothetical protein
MGFNFNSSNSHQEYLLHEGLIEEVIRLYGVLIKFLVTEKINEDLNIFGDYSHLKTDSDKVYEMYMLPENSEEWDSGDFSFGQFGLNNYENISLFVAKTDVEKTGITKSLIGNLVVMPNNKIMEITHDVWEVPGINNLYTYKDSKSCLKLTCKPYDFKLINELDPTHISVELDSKSEYETLDNFFDELIEQSNAQDEEVTTVKENGRKPIVDKSEKAPFDYSESVFGDLE